MIILGCTPKFLKTIPCFFHTLYLILQKEEKIGLVSEMIFDISKLILFLQIVLYDIVV